MLTQNAAQFTSECLVNEKTASDAVIFTGTHWKPYSMWFTNHDPKPNYEAIKTKDKLLS